jgi:hypothetical protein
MGRVDGKVRMREGSTEILFLKYSKLYKKINTL